MTTGQAGRVGLRFGFAYLIVLSAMVAWWWAMTWTSEVGGPVATVLIAFLGPTVAVGSLVTWGRRRADRVSDDI